VCVSLSNSAKTEPCLTNCAQFGLKKRQAVGETLKGIRRVHGTQQTGKRPLFHLPWQVTILDSHMPGPHYLEQL
jgi:hypothetical protein